MIERLSGREVYRNQWLSLREDRVQRDDGSQGVYSVVDKPPMAIVLAIDEGDDGPGVWLVEQYRYTLGRRVWELPQGAYESGPQITPEALARQELREETGLVAGRVERLGDTMYVASGFCSQEMHAFAALDLHSASPSVRPPSRTCSSHASRSIGSRRCCDPVRSWTHSPTRRTASG
ncbi:MAG: NUDIX hydrolase [Mycobacteriales bacterium]